MRLLYQLAFRGAILPTEDYLTKIASRNAIWYQEVSLEGMKGL